MWSKWPLNVKIALFLILMQALLLGGSLLWLSNWIEQARLNELAERLDTQSDFIESLIMVENGRLVYRRHGEFAAELDHDPELYFAVYDEGGQLLFDSEGPQPEHRRALQLRLSTAQLGSDETRLIRLDQREWLLQIGHIIRELDGRKVLVDVRVAINAQPVLNSVAGLQRVLALVGIALLLLTSLGGFIVVSASTRNLRLFAHQLRLLKPPHFQGVPPPEPHSKEEMLLFDSYRQMEAEVRNALQNQRLFIANASHELKTPIAAVTSALQVILARRRPLEEYIATCEDVLAEMQTLKRLSNALLDLARLDDNVEYTGLIDLITVTDPVVERWQRHAASRSITIQADISVYKPVDVPGTAELWEVMLGNLLDNAIKYSPDGATVVLSIHAYSQSEVKICVTDNGIGMSSEQLERLGQVFYRADDSRSNTDSFGLGFAHTKRIAEQLGVLLRVQSVPDNGTCVSLLVTRSTQ